MKHQTNTRVLWGLAVVFVFLSSVLVMSGCIGQEEEEEYDAKIAVVFATGGLGDKSFNDAAFRGLQWANETYNLKIDYVEPFEIADYEGYQKGYAEDGTYDLIIGIGFDQADPMNATAMQYPNQKFAIVDMVVFPALEENTIRSIIFREHEGSALVGAAAAFVTKTNKIGFIGGMDIWLIQKFLWGYRYGAEYINPNIEVISSFVGDWADVPKGKTLAEQMLATDVDVIYAAAGRSGIGAWDAVDETTDALSIGVDSDVCLQGYKRMLCSMLKMVDVAVNKTISDIVEGTFTAGIWELGMAENGVEISISNCVQFLTADQIAQIETLRDAIAQGTVEVPVPPTE